MDVSSFRRLNRLKTLKKVILSAGLGQPYFDHWWRRRCNFQPLTAQQITKGFYFVHIPKTAGTSVLNALGVEELPYTHCPAHIIHEKNPKAASSLFFFSVVRNPYDRFASSFEYITKRSDWPAQRKFADDVIGDLSFADFTKKLATKRLFRNLIMGYEFFFPQSYFTHRAGQSLIHSYVRFEQLSSDFDRIVRSRFTDVAELPNLRNHGGGDYRSMYDEKSAALIREIYAEDFANFDYDP